MLSALPLENKFLNISKIYMKKCEYSQDIFLEPLKFLGPNSSFELHLKILKFVDTYFIILLSNLDLKILNIVDAYIYKHSYLF